LRPPSRFVLSPCTLIITKRNNDMHRAAYTVFCRYSCLVLFLVEEKKHRIHGKLLRRRQGVSGKANWCRIKKKTHSSSRSISTSVIERFKLEHKYKEW
jgi:hypothetical protein